MPNEQTRLVVKMDSSSDDITITISSISKEGPTAAEKILTQKVLEALVAAPEFPKISGAVAGK